MYDKSIFIVGYGRTGTTLLMNIISTIQNCHISGENGNALYDLFNSVETIKYWKEKLGKSILKNEEHAWANIDKINVEKYKNALWNVFVKNIIMPPENTRIVGFKEIRAVRHPRFKEYMDFKLSLTKNSKILFTAKNDDEVKNSAWWKKKENAKKLFIQYQDKINSYHDNNKNNTYICNYNVYLNNFEETKKIFDFLEEDMDYEKIQTVINKKKYS